VRRTTSAIGDDVSVQTLLLEADMIRLGQALKLANLVESGGAAKVVLADALVKVNGEIETRRGRQLHAGDVISIGAQQVQLM
jgi:ribosome-associated protein